MPKKRYTPEEIIQHLRTHRPWPELDTGKSSGRASSSAGEEALDHRLSQTLPARLMRQVTPWSARRRWNGSLVYWLPRSE